MRMFWNLGRGNGSVYLHLGQYTVVHTRDVVGIFDIDNSSVSRSTKDYLTQAQKRGWVVNVSEEIPKSFVVCRDGDGEIKVYISQISSSTLKKRTGFIDGLSKRP